MAGMRVTMTPLIAILVAASLLACAPGSPPAPAAAPPAAAPPAAPPAAPAAAPAAEAPATLNVGQITTSALNWISMLADQEGFFRGEGIDYQPIVGTTTAGTSQALVAGATDLAVLNLVQMLAANGAGADLIAVGGHTTVPIYTLIVTPAIQSYADLRGQRLAVAGVTDPLNVILVRMLDANGLQAADYDLVPVGGTPERLAAVQGGAVAGSLLTQSDDLKAMANGLGQLGRSTDYVDHFQYTVTSVRRDWAQQNRPLLVRFLRAYVKATQFFYDPANREAAVRVLVDQTRTDRPLAEQVYDLYQQTKKTIPLHGEVDVVGARFVAENWQAFGLQQEPPPVDRAIDLSYLEEAQK
jgi:ABC-type nitrate/sulfonate/bicarbonate transport system substrate-binding protein